MNWTWKRNHLFSGSKRLENVSERSDDKFWWQNNVPHRRHQIDMQYDTTWSLYRFDSFTVRDPHRSWFYRSQSCHLSHRKTQQKHPKCVYIYIIYLCLSHHSRYCIWSVCRQYLDVTEQLLDICVYVIYIYIFTCMWIFNLWQPRTLDRDIHCITGQLKWYFTNPDATKRWEKFPWEATFSTWGRDHSPSRIYFKSSLMSVCVYIRLSNRKVFICIRLKHMSYYL